MTTNRTTDDLFPRMTVGVMGSAGGIIEDDVLRRVHRLGVLIAQGGHVLITGACPGLPQEAVKGAHEYGGVVVGVSPALNLGEHVTKYQSPTHGYDAIIYTGSGLMGREIENIRSCDVAIFAGGRSGTLGEFAIAYDEGKVIGILDGTGGISEHLQSLVGLLQKETGAIICHHTDPAELLRELEQVYLTQVRPAYEAALAGHDPDGVLES